MAHTEVVAAGAHPVVLAQRVIATRQQFLLGFVVVGGCQAVGAVFLRDAAHHPHRVLQAR